MNIQYRKWLMRFLALVLAGQIAGCGTVEPGGAQASGARLGILLIAGEGLNSSYDDIRMSGMAFNASTKFAELLQEELLRRGVPTQIHVNRDKTAKTAAYVAQLLAHAKRDGLVQVGFLHVKNDQENTLYLTAQYNAIQFIKKAEGESVLFGGGPKAKYQVSGLGKNTSFQVFAQQYADVLLKHGLIGKNKTI